MPPLHCLGRRWRTGSDDFVFSGLLFGAAQGILGVISAAMLKYSGEVCEVPNDVYVQSPHYLTNDTVIPNGLEADVLTAARIQNVAYMFAGLVMLILAYASSLGRIMEPSRRAKSVPALLYASFFSITSVAIISIVLAILVYGSPDRLAPCRLQGAQSGASVRVLIYTQTIMGFLPLGIFALLFFAAFDPHGQVVFTENNSDSYERLWDKRFGWLVCRCLRKDPDSAEAFRSIAEAFSHVFQGVDLVPSDIAAGMVLVQGYQKRLLKERIRNRKYPTVGTAKVTKCECCMSVEEKVSRQARKFSPVSSALQKDIAILYRYRRFFMAAYGWALAVFKDPAEAMPLICCNPCFYCTKPKWEHSRGEWCMCDSNILVGVGHLKPEDIILTDFRNGLYTSPHFVCIDQSPDCPEDKAIVIGIRGSMSIDDALTDMAAQPALLDLGEKFAQLGPCYVHGGMLKTTEKILAGLVESGIIKEIGEGKYSNLKVVLIGHSLGAGCCIILSLIMMARYPHLKERILCVSYAPPGGLLSKNLSDFTKTYVISGFFGLDIVPRIAMHTIEDLRTSIIDAICASKQSKSTVFCRALMNSQKTKLLDENESPTPEVLKAREKLLRSGVRPAALQAAQASPVGANIQSSSATFSSHSGNYGSTTPISPSGVGPVAGFSIITPPPTATEGTNFSPAASTTTQPVGDRPSLRTMKLYPPGQLVYFAKAVTRSTKCLWGLCHMNYQEFYVPTYVGIEQLQEIVCSPRMLTDHFPNNLLFVIENCFRRMQEGGLDAFFEGAMNEQEDTTEAERPTIISVPREVTDSAASRIAHPGGVDANTTITSALAARANPSVPVVRHGGALSNIGYRFPSARRSTSVVSPAGGSHLSGGGADGAYVAFPTDRNGEVRRRE